MFKYETMFLLPESPLFVDSGRKSTHSISQCVEHVLAETYLFDLIPNVEYSLFKNL